MLSPFLFISFLSGSKSKIVDCSHRFSKVYLSRLAEQGVLHQGLQGKNHPAYIPNIAVSQLKTKEDSLEVVLQIRGRNSEGMRCENLTMWNE